MERNPKILVVDDDPRLRDLLRRYLGENGFQGFVSENGAATSRLWVREHFDALILDLMMPGEDGLQILRRLRAAKDMTPVIMLTARDSVIDKVSGLDSGADDYITKPFGGGELLARIRAALRHARNQVAGPSYTQTGVYRAGELCIDFDRHLVQLEGQDVHLTQSEYKIVSLLTRYAGKVLTYDFIIREIWGEKATGDTQNLRANMAKIRRKLEKNPGKPQYIFTEVGVGYRMAEGE